MIKKFDVFVKESINDKLKLKVLFLCGIPNSGKSTFVKNIFDIPFTNIDMDKYIKLFADKEGVDLDLRPNSSNFSKKTDIRIKSRDLSIDRMENAINSLSAIVIDGTGRDVVSVLNQKYLYESYGYDTAMVYIETDLETALQRNSIRDRKIPEQVIIDIHGRLSKNVEKFKHEFKNFWIYNAKEDVDGKQLKFVSNKVRKFFYSPINNLKGIKTLSDMKNMKLKYLSDYDDSVNDIDLYKN